MTAKKNSIITQEPEENEKKGRELLDCKFDYLHLCSVLDNIISGAHHAQEIIETLYVNCEAAATDSELDKHDKLMLERLKILRSCTEKTGPEN